MGNGMGEEMEDRTTDGTGGKEGRMGYGIHDGTRQGRRDGARKGME